MRRAFSLAEVMIAIAILGIGMLMVAASFPVGMEQTRQATEDTLRPLVVSEAMASLRLLMDFDAGGQTIRHAMTIGTTGWSNEISGINLNDWLANKGYGLWPSGNQPRYGWTMLWKSTGSEADILLFIAKRVAPSLRPVSMTVLGDGLLSPTTGRYGDILADNDGPNTPIGANLTMWCASAEGVVWYRRLLALTS